jgi:SOS-response transcriptional repressor LexA
MVENMKKKTTPTKPAPKPPNQPTKRQLSILEFMRSFQALNQEPATVRQIMAAFQIKSPNGVMASILALARKGLVYQTNKHWKVITPAESEAVQLLREALIAVPNTLAVHQQIQTFLGRNHGKVEVNLLAGEGQGHANGKRVADGDQDEETDESGA